MNQQAQRLEVMAEKRTALGKRVKNLRQQGWVPGVMYGRDFDPVVLQFEERSLGQILSHVSGSQLVGINIKGEEEQETALVRDVQRDVIRGNVLHVDFYRVRMTERLTAEIPLLLVGESPIAVLNEGVLLQGVSAVEVECLPGDLVDSLAVDLADLVEIDQGVFVRDLAVPAGIDILTDPDEMIVRVVAMREEEELEEIAIEELEGEEIEVITEAGEEEEPDEEE